LAIPDAPLSSIHAFRGEPSGCRALFAPGTKEAEDAGVEGAEKPAAIDYSRHSPAWLGNRPEQECIAKSRLHQAALNYERTKEVAFFYERQNRFDYYKGTNAYLSRRDAGAAQSVVRRSAIERSQSQSDVSADPR
jgi:hypothetical protein